MLQGSLDNFGLNEVLGLLADTSKTGRMRITGDRGSGSLWLMSGKLVGSEASRVDDHRPIEEKMFELLRFSTGNFSFNSDETIATPSDERSVDDVLGAAFERLYQWREIESVVPSLAHIVAPVAVLPAPEVTITAEEWEVLMAIGGGSEVGSICEHFGLGEVEGSHRVKLLIERSLIEIADPVTMLGGAATAAAGGVPAAAAAVPAAAAAAAESDDFGLAPAGLTTDDTIVSPMAAAGAFDALPASSDPSIASPSSVDSMSETPPAPPWTPTADTHAPGVGTPTSQAMEPPEPEVAIFDPPAVAEAPMADTSTPKASAASVFDAPAPPPPAFGSAEHDTFGAESDEFSFPHDPPAPQAGPLRRASDFLPPQPPAPPASFGQFDAPAPPPPAPPSPADLVGSERVDGAEARRLLAGRATFAEDGTEVVMDDQDANGDADEDGSLLMQFLSDER